MKSRMVHTFDGVYSGDTLEPVGGSAWMLELKSKEGEILELFVTRTSFDQLVVDFLRRVPTSPGMKEAIASHHAFDRT